jgi:hypothetical protein
MTDLLRSSESEESTVSDRPSVHGSPTKRSERGIDGIERMRLVRDDITARVRALADDVGVAPGEVGFVPVGTSVRRL